MHYFWNRLSIFQFIISFWVVIFFTAPVWSATLYERSLQQLGKRVQGASSDDFTFIVLGDSRDNDEVFRQTLKKVTAYNPLFILHNGDTVFTGTEGLFTRFLGMIQATTPDIPVFVVIGNHDLTRKVKEPHSRDLFQRMIGPVHFTLDFPKLDMRIVAVDNAIYKLTPGELQYLDQQLEKGRKVNFAAMHIPPKTERWPKHSFSSGADRLMEILSRRNIAAAFFSHIHFYDEDTIQGVKYMITGGAGAPLSLYPTTSGKALHHFIVVRVKNGAVTTKVIPVD